MALFRRQANGMLYRFQIAAQPPVPFGGESLQVDVGSVDERQQCPPGGLLNRSVGNQDVEHPPLMNQSGAVPDVLPDVLIAHLFATLSLKNGVDVKTLSGALGHYSAGFTLNTYNHATAQMKQDAADTIGAVISGEM